MFSPAAAKFSPEEAHDSSSSENEEAEEDEGSALSWASSPAAQQHPSPVKSLPPSSPAPESSPESPVKVSARVFALQSLPPDSSGLQQPSQPPPERYSRHGQPPYPGEPAGSDNVSTINAPNIESTSATLHVAASDDLQGSSTTSALFSTAVQPLKTPRTNPSDKTRPSTADSHTLDSSAVKAIVAVTQEAPASSIESSPQRIQESPQRKRSFSPLKDSPVVARTSPTTPRPKSQGLSGLEYLAVRSSPAKLVPSTFQPHVSRTLLSDLAIHDNADHDIPSNNVATNAEQQNQNEMEAPLLANSQMEIGANTTSQCTPRSLELGSISGSPTIYASRSDRRSEKRSSPPPSFTSSGNGRVARSLLADAQVTRISRPLGSSTFHLSQDSPVAENPAKAAAKRRREFLNELAEKPSPKGNKKLKIAHESRAGSHGEPPVDEDPQSDSALTNELQTGNSPSAVKLPDNRSATSFKRPGSPLRLELDQPVSLQNSIQDSPYRGPQDTSERAMQADADMRKKEQDEYCKTLPSLGATEKADLTLDGVCTRCRLPGHKHWEQDKCGLTSPDYDGIVYMEFRRKYPQYNGDKTHFTNMCRDIFKQEQSRKPLTAAFWDDYIIRHLAEYNPYAVSLLNQGLPSRPYADYYNRMVDDPMHTKMVLTHNKLSSMSFAIGYRYVPSSHGRRCWSD
jgi:hypothetical protein